MLDVNFPTSLEEARRYQEKVAQQLILKDEFEEINLITALDVAYKNERATAAAIIYDWKEKKLIEKKCVETFVNFEYVSSFLFLREVPIFLKLINLLENNTDLFLVDGHGIAHPLFAGSAAIFGYLTKKPVIGVAKAPMNIFEYRNKERREDLLITDIYVKNKLVGKRIAFLKKRWKPIYVSPGNKISITSSLDLLVSLLEPKQHKLPKPLLLAHLTAKKCKENLIK